ncbi:hypothetical protein L1987_35238 [Smallanthus sonchifolius]|uniref:Uncharacterized protein n=1 Tax=Smallanthus sonchifolius TaxID=185202 RepID=A0ACB9HYP4_9ASTR|nr:hypothetical protein L1987_35238 [Smallanthus sonchifolius]
MEGPKLHGIHLLMAVFPKFQYQILAYTLASKAQKQTFQPIKRLNGSFMRIKHWSELVTNVYIAGLGVNWSSVSNVMDMNDGYGGLVI